MRTFTEDERRTIIANPIQNGINAVREFFDSGRWERKAEQATRSIDQAMSEPDKGVSAVLCIRFH